MSIELLRPAGRAQWRAWLVANHDRASEVWVAYGKKGSGLISVGYEDSVLEALCFGWIDSSTRRIDESLHACRFTPRRSRGRWSESNRARVRLLRQQGLMTPAGLAALPEDLRP